MNVPNPENFPPVDPNAPTQPVRRADPLAQYQPIRVPGQPATQKAPRKPVRRRPAGCGGCVLVVLLALFGSLALYLLAPLNTRILLLGVDLNGDRAPAGSFVGRTDTIILVQVNPLRPEVHMLSIPRDLWVPIPGVGENRINTAHFFAEAEQPGSGPQAVLDVIQANFGVKANYYARVRIDSFQAVIDALGGIDLNLSEPTGGLDAGKHHLDGEQALAFSRDRSGTDDFFRMNQGQMVVIATARQVLNPLSWPRLPGAVSTFLGVVDTNLPVWQWPRLGLALIRAGSGGIDHRTISREMVLPFTTDGGAQVLGPNWELIRPMIVEMFGK